MLNCRIVLPQLNGCRIEAESPQPPKLSGGGEDLQRKAGTNARPRNKAESPKKYGGKAGHLLNALKNYIGHEEDYPQ